MVYSSNNNNNNPIAVNANGVIEDDIIDINANEEIAPPLPSRRP